MRAPAWVLKLVAAVGTLLVFVGSFGYASAHVYNAAAPLQPAQASATPAPATVRSNTRNLRTTTQPPLTRTRSS